MPTDKPRHICRFCKKKFINSKGRFVFESLRYSHNGKYFVCFSCVSPYGDIVSNC